jgi:hypothetical protein
MKYKIEEHPNTELETFHITEKLCEEWVHMVTSMERFNLFANEVPKGDRETLKYLAGTLLAIPGVTELSFHNYELRVHKAELFDWPEIEEQVVHVIKSILAKDDELVEMPRKACTEADRRRAKAEWERAERMYGGFDNSLNMDDFNEDEDDRY